MSGLIGSYLQVFRNGALESVNTRAEREPTVHPRQVPFLEIELRLFQCLPEYFDVLKCLGVQPPVALGLSLIGVEGYSMEIPFAATPSGRQQGRIHLPHTNYHPALSLATRRRIIHSERPDFFSWLRKRPKPCREQYEPSGLRGLRM
jgi:hypothetical protein